MTFVGWILIAIGIVFLLLSVAAAVVAVFPAVKDGKHPSAQAGAGDYIRLIDALRELVKVVLTGPTWFILFVLGIASLGLGVRLVTVGTL